VAKGVKPAVHTLEGGGPRYLYGKNSVLFENGVRVPRETFDAAKNMPGEAGKLAAGGGQLYDWAYACTTGILRRRPPAPPPRAGGPEKQKKEAGQKENPRRRFSSAFLVMAAMATVGLGSAVMSAYHTSAFLYEGGKPAWASLMTGAMFILFSGTAFTAARYFFREGGAVSAFGALFIAAGLAVAAYSMFSTLAVNFNQFKRREDGQAAAAMESGGALAAHREQMRVLGEEIDAVAGEIAVLRGEADYWRAQSWRRYDGIQEQLAGRSEYLSSLRERYGALAGGAPRLAEAEALSRETVYDFLSNISGAGKDAVRFFVYIVPACLYDILAPFALSVVLLLADRRRE
jgi:hypothetical protein